jgi:hypothetical protein
MALRGRLFQVMLYEEVFYVLQEHGPVEGGYFGRRPCESCESRQIKAVGPGGMLRQLSDVRAISKEIIACSINPHSTPPVIESQFRVKPWES